jgi:microcystin-dependent protein
MEVYMGTILPFAFNYPPYGFALCYGQQYSVGQYQALYSLLGIFYGGNGTTTFNLPNLSGRMLIGSGPAQTDINMPAHNVGAKGGNSIAALTTANMPMHTHGTSNLKAQLLAGGTLYPLLRRASHQPKRHLLAHQVEVPGWPIFGPAHCPIL